MPCTCRSAPKAPGDYPKAPFGAIMVSTRFREEPSTVSGPLYRRRLFCTPNLTPPMPAATEAERDNHLQQSSE